MTTMKPFYDKDGVILHCGDNCEVMRGLPSESIDLVVTSPPYDDLRTYGGHSWDFYGVAWNLKRLLKPGGVIVWVVSDQTRDGSESGTSMPVSSMSTEIAMCGAWSFCENWSINDCAYSVLKVMVRANSPRYSG